MTDGRHDSRCLHEPAHRARSTPARAPPTRPPRPPPQRTCSPSSTPSRPATTCSTTCSPWASTAAGGTVPPAPSAPVLAQSRSPRARPLLRHRRHDRRSAQAAPRVLNRAVTGPRLLRAHARPRPSQVRLRERPLGRRRRHAPALPRQHPSTSSPRPSASATSPTTPKALAEIHRVLAPGGTLGILECNQPDGSQRPPLHAATSRYVLPLVGGLISGDRKAYRYLPASVARFPRPPQMLP